MKQVQPESDETLHFWQCPNCGQTHFSDQPPDMCAFCDDFTTWRIVQQFNVPRGGLRVREDQGEVHYIQLPLPLIFYDED